MKDESKFIRTFFQAKSHKPEAKTFQRWVRHDAIASLPEYQKDEVGISDPIWRTTVDPTTS